MSEQFAPAASQRSHWRVNAIVGVPFHVPSFAVSVGVPVIDGSVTFVGGAASTVDDTSVVESECRRCSFP